jgi:FlaA1/EpsC-like NDP-sugar epimerase
MQGNHAFTPVAFIDDDRTMFDKRICGLPVRAREDLPWLVQKYDVSHVLLAMPSVSRRARRDVIESLEPLPVHVQTVPNIEDLEPSAGRAGRKPHAGNPAGQVRARDRGRGFDRFGTLSADPAH